MFYVTEVCTGLKKEEEMHRIHVAQLELFFSVYIVKALRFSIAPPATTVFHKPGLCG